ncbi:MAG: rhomboid family intramembrane serine protease [Bdellovibrionales bacterium]|nr:rhomboid family intramembrane serine protease [Bdellovibrionales bacterium]
MNCIQCRRALAVTTSVNGFTASCGDCGIEHLSLGRLMKLSDSQLTSRIWDLIHSETLRPDWKAVGPCPRCPKTLIAVPFRHGGKEHGLVACSECHMIAMKGPTLALFRESNTVAQEKKLAETRSIAHAKRQQELDRDLETAKRLVRTGLERAEYLLTETPLREVRVTILSGVAATGLSLFTMLMPYTAMETFGGATSTAVLSAFTHVTFFQLAWNLLFFLPLGSVAEREMGSVRFALTFGAILVVANTLGRLISPFPDAPLIGMSPLVAALIGRNLVLGIPLRIRSVTFEMRTVAFVFTLSELRTMIPTSGGMRWFTLGACFVAAVVSAAVTEWQRRRLVEGREEGVSTTIVALRSASTPAVKPQVKSPAKRAA